MRKLKKPRTKVADIGDAWHKIGKVRSATARPLCVVVDPLDATVDRSTLSALLELRENSPVPFGIVFVSSVPWMNLFPEAELDEPQHVPFPAYQQNDILHILRSQRPDSIPRRTYEYILVRFIRQAFHSSRLLTDAQTLLKKLVAEVIEADVQDAAKTVEHLHQVSQEQDLELAEHYPGIPFDVYSLVSTAKPGSSSQPCAQVQPLLGIPTATKLLLLAAYIAANNRPAADRRVFSHAPSAIRRKDVMGADRQGMAAEEEESSRGQVRHSPQQA
jgi:hypothetical protein